jgi:hypothetical protein
VFPSLDNRRHRELDIPVNNTEANTITIDETEVAREATRLIAAAAAKHGLATSEITQDVKDRATAEARVLLESRAQNKGNSEDYRALFEASEQRAKLAESQLAALRNVNAPSPGKPMVTKVEQARARVGEVGWFKMSPDQRVAALGVDPASVDKAQLGLLFGKNSDHVSAVAFQRANPKRYAELREVAKVLGTY